MPEALERLRQEHRDIARLLDILEAELARFGAAEAPDYDVMAAIADYFTGYPAACHHPKEDLVYAALVERRPDCAGTIGDIETEHVQLGEMVDLFARAVRNVMNDAEVSRDAFDRIARHFIEAQRLHIEREEEKMFPLAAEALTDAEWTAIDGKIADSGDPLFGAMPEERFAALRRDIEAWEGTRFT